MHCSKNVSISLGIKILPSIVLPCADLDIYPKVLSLVSVKYTKAKIKSVKGEMPQICWPCCWCDLQAANQGDAHSISHTTLDPFYTFSAKRAAGIIQIHTASAIHPFPQD